MASALREKYMAKYSKFSSPPGWTNSNDLGYVSTRTSGELLTRLGLGRWSAPGNDYVQDTLSFLSAAVRTSVLNGLFTEAIQRGNNIIEVYAAADMYNSSSGGAIMLKFIKALLADAEKSGKIAMPGRTNIYPGADRRSVIVEFDLQK